MNSVNDFLEMDIYLIDQIMKGRYQKGERILFAGVGSGRNLRWFAEKGLDIVTLDANPECESMIFERYGRSIGEFHASTIIQNQFEDREFDHVVCSAVLHFAEGHEQFESWFTELYRVLKPEGSMFIRTCTDIGIEGNKLRDGVSELPDGSVRYLLSMQKIEAMRAKHELAFLGDPKTTVVVGKRSMGTFVLTK